CGSAGPPPYHVETSLSKRVRFARISSRARDISGAFTPSPYSPKPLAACAAAHCRQSLPRAAVSSPLQSLDAPTVLAETSASGRRTWHLVRAYRSHGMGIGSVGLSLV